MLPSSVLDQIAHDLKGWHRGISVMELSHRIPEMIAMTEQTAQDMRDLLNIPENFKILFMQGGARGQFSAIPLNLLGDNSAQRTASYLLTGHWSEQAVLEAQKYAKINTFSNMDHIIEFPNTAYLHCTDNETINGIELPALPISTAPVVVDASSSILSKPINFNQVSLVYAATQKNLGIAGLTVVIIREDLITKAHSLTPAILDYRIMSQTGSMMNTPPVFCWYVTGLMLKWVQAEGGVLAIQQQVLEKSKLLYELIDNSHYYRNTIHPLYRSKMNITFNLPTPALEQAFLKEAEQVGLFYLKGHRVLGGIRASLYNAMPLAGVKTLVDFMKKFAHQ